MEGVQILNQFEVVTKEVFSWNSFWWGALIGAIVGLVAATIGGLNEAGWTTFFIDLGIFGTTFALLIGIIGGAVLKPKPVEYETHYEVSIDSNVSMTEFMDKYEIIDTRGFIYTVREK